MFDITKGRRVLTEEERIYYHGNYSGRHAEFSNFFDQEMVVLKQNIEDYVAINKMTWTEFGQLVGMSKDYVSKWRKSSSRDLTIAAMIRLADLTDTTLSEVLIGENVPVVAPISIRNLIQCLRSAKNPQPITELIQSYPVYATSSSFKLIDSRFGEMAEDYGTLKNCVFKEFGTAATPLETHCLAQQSQQITAKVLYMLCLGLKASPDYLAIQDYSSREILVDGKPIRQGAFKQQISMFLRLSPEHQKECIGKLMEEYYI